MRRHKISLLSPFLRPRRLLPLCLLSALIATSASAQTPPLSEQLELRGISRIDGVFEFSIYNKERKRSEWLRPREPLEGYEILDYDFEKRYVRIRFGDQIGQIILHEAQVAPYVASTPEPTPPPPVTMVKPSHLPPIPPPPPSTIASRPGPANRSTNGLQNDRRSSNSDFNQPVMTGGSFRGVRPAPGNGNPPAPTNPDDGGNNPDPSNDTPPPPPPSMPPSYTPSSA